MSDALGRRREGAEFEIDGLGGRENRTIRIGS
jgi:hypothetical protein